MKVCGSEILKHKNDNTWKYISIKLISEDTQILSLKWIWAYKLNKDNNIIKYKAQICVREDLYIIDRDMYAATDFYRTFWFLIALIAIFDMYVTQQDVVSAFTKTKLLHSVYVRCSLKFNRTGYAMKLNNALYGLPKSA